MKNLSDWNASLLSFPSYHLFQTKEWATVKEGYGWQPIPFTCGDDTASPRAMVLERSISLGKNLIRSKILYVPRGPLVNWENISQVEYLMDHLEQLGRERQAIFIKIDPEVFLGKGIPGDQDEISFPSGERIKNILRSRGWVYSSEQIQFQNSIWIDLISGEDEILARMKQKTRYNVKLATKKGVVIRQGSEKDFDQLFQLYAQTSLRDGFAIRGKQYYFDVWSRFISAGMATPFLAEYEGEILGGLFLFWFGKKSWYLYGMSSEAHRDLMPNYGLQWSAIQFARQQGCEIYDLWGAPDHFDGQDRMSGVFRFKQGLGGEVVRMIGAWDFPIQKSRYNIYTQVLPKVMAMMRRKGKQATLQEVGG